jgi:hypothetical protein
MDTVLIYSHCGKEPSLDTLNIESKYKDSFNNIPYSEVVEFDDKILKQLKKESKDVKTN